jgi:hypothetical protein
VFLARGADLPYRGVMTIAARIGCKLQLGLLLLVALSFPACMATVGAQNLSIPKNAAQTCGRHCKSIGMRLSAVAIMAENVGCVCQHASEQEASEEEAGALSTPAAGMATVVMQEAAAVHARQQQQQQHRRRN